MQMKLYWKPDLANAYLVAEKQPRRDQPVFARVYIKNDREEFKGWNTQMYVSALWPGATSVLDERPVGFGGSNHDSFKQARKNAEDIVVRWFKGRSCDKCKAYSELTIVSRTPVREETQTDTTSLLDMFMAEMYE